MEKFTPLATNFTLPPGLTGWTNSTSGGEGSDDQDGDDGEEKNEMCLCVTEVEFVHAVTAGGSVKVLPAV